MRARLSTLNGRREAIYLALAAAEVCWAAPVFLALSRTTGRHPPLLLWLGMVILLLGCCHFYRALALARLPLLLRQTLLAVAIFASIGLVLRFHVYAGAGLEGGDWLLQPIRSVYYLETALPDDLVAILTLIYLWARGLHLARRSLSAAEVGFSFRGGVVLFILVAAAVGLITGKDVSGFIAPYFFFALVAVALARVEEVSRIPGSRRAPFTGFWIGSTVAAVALLVFLGSLVAVFFSGGGLEQLFRWLSPVFAVLQVVISALAVLILSLVGWLVSLVPVDWGALQGWLQELGRVLSEFEQLMPPPEEGQPMPLETVRTVRAGVVVAIIAGLVFLVLLFSWWRVRQTRREGVDESRESLLSARAVARNLLAVLQAGRDRLGELAGLVERFGVGARLFSAISIRRIYANVVRLATHAGYPRQQAQTPLEYLDTLHEAFPHSRTEVVVITEAYVNAHYGQVPDSQEELQRIRECWQRLRAQGVEPR